MFPEGPVDRHQDLPGPRPVTVLAQPHTLPGAKVKLPIRQRDRQIRTQEASFDMRRL